MQNRKRIVLRERQYRQRIMLHESHKGKKTDQEALCTCPVLSSSIPPMEDQVTVDISWFICRCPHIPLASSFIASADDQDAWHGHGRINRG